MYKSEAQGFRRLDPPRFDFVEGRTLPYLSRDPLQVGRLTGRRHAATRTQPGRLRVLACKMMLWPLGDVWLLRPCGSGLARVQRAKCGRLMSGGLAWLRAACGCLTAADHR